VGNRPLEDVADFGAFHHPVMSAGGQGAT
jgi:hypothetical protein